MKSVKNCVEVIILLIVLGAATFSQRDRILEWFDQATQPPLPPAVEHTVFQSEPQTEETAELPEPPAPTQPTPEPTPLAEPTSADTLVLPVAMNLAVPFTSQAPFGEWGEPYKEACEETSLYMVHAYYSGIKAGTIDSATADQEIKKIVAFEEQLFGYYEDTTAVQTGMIAEMMMGYEQIEVIEQPTVEQIKTHLAEGRPVIVPVAGRDIGNPYFTAPGPIYHMLVIRGYTANGQFITNDPGTRHGESYLYPFETIMSALHDWNRSEDIHGGKAVVLVVYPN